MGSKGANTTTQSQTYTGNPTVTGAGTQAINMATNAANTPFSLPAAPVAGFTPDQLAAFQATNQAQGMAQPYFQQGANYINQSAQPVTAAQVQNYYNPMAANVMAGMQDVFGEQQSQTTGQLQQAAGGIGADRVAVGQADLAKQQSLAAGQTLAGLYQPALQAAQQQQQMEANAGYGMANLGAGAQGAQLQGIQAQLATGGLQQQLQQAQLNSPYQQQLAQLAYPFQTAQYLAGITGGLAGAFGGTTNGQTTVPPPNPFGQYAGLAVAGLGAAGQAGAFSGSGGKGSGGAGSVDGKPAQANGGRVHYAGGGGIGGVLGRSYAGGGGLGTDPFGGVSGYVPDIAMQMAPVNYPKLQQPAAQSANSGPDVLGTAMKFLPLLLAARGGAVADNPYDDHTMNKQRWDLDRDSIDRGGPSRAPWLKPGEEVNTPGTHIPDSQGMGRDVQQIAQGGAVNPYAPMQGYADGGDTSQDYINNNWVGIEQAKSKDASPLPFVQNVGLGQPVTDTGFDTGAPTEARNSYRPPMPLMPPPSTSGVTLPQRGVDAGTGTASGDTPDVASQLPYDNHTRHPDEGQKFLRSPWGAVTQAGLAMMAGTSPFAGVNIGAGALQGFKALEKNREQDRSEEEVNLRAKQLMQQASFHEDAYKRLTKAQELESLKPMHYMDDPNTGLARFAVRDPKTGQLIDTQTRQPVDKTGAPGSTQAPASGAPAFPQEPPPLGIKELGTNLEPTKSTTPTMMKGPFAGAEAKTIQGIDAQMTKARPALEVQRDQISRLKNDYAIISRDADKDGFWTKLMQTPGADPEARVDVMKKANLVATAANKTPPFAPEKVAAMEEAIKIQKTMGMSFAATISPRDSMQMQMASISAQPGFTASPQGMQRLIGLYDGLNRANTAEHDYWQRWKAVNPHTSVGWETDFRNKNPTDKFMVGAMLENLPNQKAKAVLPQAIEDLRKGKDDPRVVQQFNKHYNNTASYFLTGHMDPYAPLAGP